MFSRSTRHPTSVNALKMVATTMKAPAVPRSHAKCRSSIPTATVEIQTAIPVETAVGVFHASSDPAGNETDEEWCNRRSDTGRILVGVVIARTNDDEQDDERNVSDKWENSVLHVSIPGV